MASKTIKHVRGMQDIRTHAGKVDHLSHPHMAYLRISVLEMEKARRNQEKESALRRISAIDDRLREIEAEKAEIEKILAAKEAVSNAKTRKLESGVANDSDYQGFKIRY